MKRLNFNIKDRKVLTLGLCLVVICVFTLTVAYAALNAVLTISGNAEVVSSTWDIYLDNPRVTGGSATTNVPVIKTSSTLEFETTLNMPGDFYEFVVDVVNAGSIDAMIENVVKTPELTTEQAKFLKYEITYQNGESITTKQLLAKDTTMPIKVRIEYRKDLSNTDLPTGQVVLDLSLTLEYIQSDGSGSSVDYNGYFYPRIISGDEDAVGSEIAIGDENFYIISSNESSITMLSKYNLSIGYICYSSTSCVELENPSKLQDSLMLGRPADGSYPRYGTVPFSSDLQKGENYSDYSGSLIEEYINDYKNVIENMGGSVLNARLITVDELTSIFSCVEGGVCSDTYSWINSTSYWSGTASSTSSIYGVRLDGGYGSSSYKSAHGFGVRPVIVISKDYFN